MAAAEKAPPNRTQIPNIVDDLGLNPYERTLYVHYKRVCGENPGAYCFEATKTTAQKVKMSTGQVSEARKSLALRGLVIVQESRPVVVTIVNIWELNTAFYKLEHRPDVDGWGVEQIKRWLYDMSSDVHTVNVSSHNDSNLRSPDETNLPEDDKKVSDVHTVNEKLEDVHTVNVNGNMSSYVHTVKQRRDSLDIGINPSIESKRESSESRAREPVKGYGDFSLSLAKVCLINLETISQKRSKEFADTVKTLLNVKATPEQVVGFGEWWKTNWRYTKSQNHDPPTLSQVCDLWGEYQASNQTTKQRMVIT